MWVPSLKKSQPVEPTRVIAGARRLNVTTAIPQISCDVFLGSGAVQTQQLIRHAGSCEVGEHSDRAEMTNTRIDESLKSERQGADRRFVPCVARCVGAWRLAAQSEDRLKVGDFATRP